MTDENRYKKKMFRYTWIMLFVFACLWAVIAKPSNVYAEPFHATPEQLEGTAYAVLTNSRELILFRSNDTYTEGAGQTVTDIKGNTYTGQVYTGIETTNTASTSNSKWYSQRTSIKSVRIADGQVIKPINTSYWFYRCNNTNLKTMDLSRLDTSNVTNMNSMFNYCSSLTSLDVSGFDTSNVTDMYQMFYNCQNLTTLDVSDWDTSNATNMDSMFAYCYKLTSLDVSGLDTSNVTNMGSMFRDCFKLTSLDVSGLDTSNVTSISSMFYNCSNLTSLDVSGFDTSNVTDMSHMFGGCYGLTSLDVSGFDTSNVTNMDSVFSQCSNLTGIDVSNFNTNKVTSMYSMFYDCSSLASLYVSGFDTGNVTSMGWMFHNCSRLTNLDVSGFDTSNVTDMSYMFDGCSAFASLDISGFDTSNVTDMNSMFNYCSSLTSLDVSGFDTSNVTDMSYMFDGCSAFARLDISGFDTSNVTNMYQMFHNCSRLTNLDLSGWNTGNVTDMSGMFSGCASLKSLDISGFDTSNIQYYNYDDSWIDENTGEEMFSIYGLFRIFHNNQALSSVVLGEDFNFADGAASGTTPPPEHQAILTTPPTNAYYTGKWVQEEGTVENAYTAEELRDNYDGATMAGTWVWQMTPTAFKVKFTPSEGASGSMPGKLGSITEDFTLPENTFYQFGKDFDHWEVTSPADLAGTTYEDKATIAADEDSPLKGKTVTLKAIMKDADTSYTIENGTFDFYLRANEKATFKNIPAGTAYQVYEETPDGWVLVDQSNVSGTIEPLQTARAQFVNKYQPDVTTVQFTGTKKLDGYAVPEGAYSFELYEEGKDEPTETVATKDGGFVQFSIIEYAQEDVGDHIYHIKEVNPNDDAIDWDKHEETITVNVKDNGDGTLSAKATYDSDGIVFNNRTKPGMLKITKRTNIKTPENQNDKFTFNITFNNEKGQPISDDIYWYSEGVNRQD